MCLCSQPLTVTTASLTLAENLADLIDGYCRLISNETHSFIVRVQKGRKCLSHLLGILTIEKPYALLFLPVSHKVKGSFGRATGTDLVVLVLSCVLCIMSPKAQEFLLLYITLSDDVCFCPLEGERALPSIPK